MRIIDLDNLAEASRPVIDSTCNWAQVNPETMVTYGAIHDSSGTVVAVWGMDGKLIRALKVPLHSDHSDQGGTADGIGLLPREAATFYHFAKTGRNRFILRMQDLRNPAVHRSYDLNITVRANGDVSDLDDEHMYEGLDLALQIDVKQLAMKGGVFRYRVSASGYGAPWGPWHGVPLGALKKAAK